MEEKEVVSKNFIELAIDKDLAAQIRICMHGS